MPSKYTIGGCQVHFPHQAYGTQLSFMSKVIAALEGGHNALLEAPTGV
jgi:Fanconi anemia group J protein